MSNSNKINPKINPLIQTLTSLLKEKNLCLTTAESCTGGLAASFLTQLPGSSAWFERGFVTYSNLAKEEMLGVDKTLIETYGAVSLEVARAMALGALNFSHADLSFAITGIAGPEGGSPEKPVGTVCFAWALRGSLIHSDLCHLIGDRQAIRELACVHAFEGMITLVNR